jgi:uncharacterized protein (TIGR03437 family)
LSKLVFCKSRQVCVSLLAISSSLPFAFAQYVDNAAFATNQIAPGSLVKIYWSAPLINDAQSIRVEFQPQGSDQIFNAQILSSAQYPILVVAPKDIPLGPATVTLTLDSMTYPPNQVRIVRASIGIFTMSPSGLGPATAQNISDTGSTVLNQLTSPALPGQYVTLWATGLGDFTTPDVTVSIAGKLVQPSFAGPSPGLPGVDQINFNVPTDVTFGCYVPVTVSAGTYASNSPTIALAEAAGACSHPLGLSPDDLLTLDQGGSVFAGSMNFNVNIGAPGPNMAGYTRFEYFFATFRVRSALETFLISPKVQTVSNAPACSLSSSLVLLTLAAGPGDVAGPSLTLTGPANETVNVPTTGSEYSFAPDPPPAVSTPANLPPLFFAPGVWQIAAPGGFVVSAFQQVYQLPPQVRWTNRGSLTTFGRDADVTILWDPRDYSANDTLHVFLMNGTPTAISCQVPAQLGELVLPATLLLQIASGPGTLELYISPQQPTVFNIPLINSGTAPAIVTYFFSDSLAVTIQ